MTLATGPGQPGDPLPVQIEQPDVAVVVRYGNHSPCRHGQPIDGRIRPDGGQGRAHVAQLPHLYGAVVRARDHLVVAGEYGGCYAPAKEKGVI